jgi:hypothetical protein
MAPGPFPAGTNQQLAGWKLIFLKAKEVKLQ